MNVNISEIGIKMNFEIDYTFTKNIYVVDAKDEADARAKANAFFLNLLNQIPDNQALLESWIEVKVTKVGE